MSVTNNVEIERKYLLTAIPPEVFSHPSLVISQGWLPGDTIKERIRETFHTDTGMLSYRRAIKVGKGLSRFEFEEVMSKELFEALWPFTEGRRIGKRRFRVTEAADIVWEVDNFSLLPPLYMAEIELPQETTAVNIPAWLQPYLVREVTNDPAYTNQRLAR